MENEPDFSVADHGSIAILFALTEAAKEWVNDHLPEDGAGGAMARSSNRATSATSWTASSATV